LNDFLWQEQKIINSHQRFCLLKACHTAEVPYFFHAMEIIRSNYSTLSPYAQAEAPAPPEYPFTRKISLYREMMETMQKKSDDSAAGVTDGVLTQSLNLSQWVPHSTTDDENHKENTFKRLLELVFGDYFEEDADDEIASDMADRWVAFARTGNPNYEGGRAKWHPWLHVANDDRRRSESEEESGWRSEELDMFDLDIESIMSEDENHSSIESQVWSEDPFERAYRRRTLKALALEVAEEDVFQTILRRVKTEPTEPENPFNQFLFGSGNKNRDGESRRAGQTKQGEIELSRRAIRQLQQIAQDMGVLGTGLRGEPSHHGTIDWEDDFFPELLELKWPPEDRLVERDCTCDMWDRIRYRY
jgi:hypothetical protein